MRKRIVGPASKTPPAPETGPWLDLAHCAQVEITSEDPAHPIDAVFAEPSGSGWRADAPGEQTIRLLFDEPQALSLMRLVFDEATQARSQEFVLRWSPDDHEPTRELVRQQFNFSPDGATRETEEYRLDLQNARVLELKIVPDRGHPEGAHATLTSLRLA